MDQATYFSLINYILIVNTLWIVGFAGLCFLWTAIAKTSLKKTIFAASGGGLLAFVFLRITVVFMPTNLPMLLMIGVLHGIMMALMFSVFGMVTMMVKKRQKEFLKEEACRKEASHSSEVERWDRVEEKLDLFGKELFAAGKNTGWIT